MIPLLTIIVFYLRVVLTVAAITRVIRLMVYLLRVHVMRILVISVITKLLS